METPQVITFGCRLNSFETEIIRDQAQKAGLSNTFVFNTCAVTSEAQRQARQAIRRTRRENPDANIIVTGCAAQVDASSFSTMDEVNLVLGNEEKLNAKHYAPADFGLSDEEKIRVNDIMSVRETAPQLIDGFGDKVRAFVQIQNGCDHRCTFCIIPFGRGNSRSVGAGEVVRQIERLVDNGYKEVVLTGVDITAWGGDLPGGKTLGDLVATILHKVPQLPRLRITSIDSIETDEQLVELIGTEKQIMPHVHLSLQAGDDMILKRMKRRHNRSQSVEFANRLKQLRPDMALGADLIAGFPTETEQMFANTLALVDDCRLDFLHVFPFSPRPGTPAAAMPQVDRKVVKQRAALLRDAGTRRLGVMLENQIGKTVSCLVETPSSARAENYAAVQLSQQALPGTIVDVRITQISNNQLEGVPV